MDTIEWSSRDGSHCNKSDCEKHKFKRNTFVYPPVRDLTVEIIVKGLDRTPKRLKGSLYFFPNQKYVQVVVMDSIGQNFERPDNAIFVRHHGAKIKDLIKWVYEEVPKISRTVPLPVRVILFGGSNDITTYQLRRFRWDEGELADYLVNQFIELDSWVLEQHVALAIANVIPRPKEVDNHVGINKFDEKVRIKLSKAFVNVNDWIEAYNLGHEGPLPLSKFVEYVDRVVGVTDTGRPILHKRLYPDCPQRRIIRSKFREDLVHLSDTGEKAVKKALLEFMDNE